MIKNEILEIDGKVTLCRWELVKDADFPTYHAVPIITKEEFLTCYNEWIRGEKERPLEETNGEHCKGKWIIIDDTEKFIAKCSVCGKIEDSRMVSEYPFCHCGADMRKGDTE